MRPIAVCALLALIIVSQTACELASNTNNSTLNANSAGSSSAPASHTAQPAKELRESPAGMTGSPGPGQTSTGAATVEKKKPQLNSNAIGGSKRKPEDKPEEKQHADRTAARKRPPLNSNSIGGTRRGGYGRPPLKPDSKGKQKRRRLK
jgi:hypothetical protein